MDITVNLMWDGDTGVWIATSDDVPGLVLESESYDKLIERVKIVVPELIEINPKGVFYYVRTFQME